MGKVKQRRQRGQRYNPAGVSQNGEARAEGHARCPAGGLRMVEEKVSGCKGLVGLNLVKVMVGEVKLTSSIFLSLLGKTAE